jgi:predicted lipoprotein with Yx(FWY)xxD motif
MSHTITSRRSLRRRLLAAVTAAASLTLVAACSSTTATPYGSTSAVSPATSASSSAASTASGITALMTTSTSLGNVVADGKGMVLYMYTKDTQGTQTSACTGGCAPAWPAALADTTPSLTGITGTVGSIPSASGGKQVTLNGWPLYYFAKDKAPGDVLGQGVGTVWYVLDSTGAPKKA